MRGMDDKATRNLVPFRDHIIKREDTIRESSPKVIVESFDALYAWLYAVVPVHHGVGIVKFEIRSPIILFGSLKFWAARCKMDLLSSTDIGQPPISFR